VRFFACGAFGFFAFAFAFAFAVACGLCLCAGIRGLLFRWHPRDVIGSQALPLCGAAPTFLCRRKEK